jgi:hypothetical protein
MAPMPSAQLARENIDTDHVGGAANYLRDHPKNSLHSRVASKHTPRTLV